MNHLSRLLPLTALLAAGCGREVLAPSRGPAARETLLISVGGEGGTASKPFNVSSNAVRIAYRMAATPSSTVRFALDRMSDAGQGTEAVHADQPAGRLEGQFTVPLISGTYRLRVQTEVAWSASVYDAPEH